MTQATNKLFVIIIHLNPQECLFLLYTATESVLCVFLRSMNDVKSPFSELHYLVQVTSSSSVMLLFKLFNTLKISDAIRDEEPPEKKT